MTVAEVYNVTWTSDESYPRLQPSHPRNRSIDWLAFRDYALEGRPGDTRFEFFVKARTEFDTVWIIGAGPVVSPRLRRTLEPLVGGPVTFLPVSVNDQPFSFLRVEHVIDALDRGRSSYLTAASGDIYEIANQTWFGDRIPEPAIFKVPRAPSQIWATPTVAQAYRDSGCTGLIFWPEGRVA